MNEESIFMDAVQKQTPEERAAYLDQACADDAELRHSVELLLRAHDRAGHFLQGLPQHDPTMDQPNREGPGTVIGPYKLLQPIGEGGMGTVYMAEQTQPVRRTVALKLIKAGMDSRQVLARFGAERQALALMDHPNIAKVFDAGTTDNGRPYFVMELVKGVPITKFCDERRLTTRERLELAIPVCQAVQHAHQKGIIHRDLKPSNVLIALYDGKPVPKIIDFGVAKATGPRLTDQTLYTEFGAVIGTLEYMSPEQAELNQLDIDTRSDIYSLGVLLYELLTGSTPLDRKRLKQGAILEMLRLIREEESPRPSMRLSTTEELPSIAACRNIEPRKLSGLVRGELDWIVMKALEKDRNRRYETANGLAADLRRFLDDEPVQACPPSARYRFGKFARRNKRALATAMVLASAMLAAVAGITGGIGWALRDRAAVAQQVARESAARQAKLEGRLSQALDEAQAEYERDDLPEAISAIKRADGLLASDNDVSNELRERADQWRAELMILQRLEELGFLPFREQSRKTDAAYSQVFLDIGINIDAMPVEEAGRRIRSRLTWRHLTEALDRWTGIRQEIAVMENFKGDGSRNKQRLLQVARAADSDELRSQARLAVEKWDLKAAEHLAASPDVSRLPASTLRQLAMVIYWGGGESRRGSANRLLVNAQFLRPGDFGLNVACASYYAQMEPPRPDQAIPYLRAALALRPRISKLHCDIGRALRMSGLYDEALAEYREAIRLKPDSPDAHNDLGALLCDDKREYDQAIACLDRAIQLDPDNAVRHVNRGIALVKKSSVDKAIAAYKQAIALDPKLAAPHYYLGNALSAKNDLPGAITEYREAIRLKPDYPEVHHNLGNVLADNGKLDAAIAEYRDVIRLKPNDCLAHSNFGVALGKKGLFDAAIVEFRAAIQLKPDLSDAHNGLGFALSIQNKLEEAITEYREAIRLKPDHTKARGNLAIALSKQGKLNEVIAEYREVIRLKPNSGDAHNSLAWALANCPDPKLRDPKKSVELAKKAVELAPKAGAYWNTLGVAQYRNRDWKAAIEALTRSMELRKGGDSSDWFFLAMAHWQLGEKAQARSWYDKAIAWMEKNQLKDEELIRFRTEAASLLGVNEKKR